MKITRTSPVTGEVNTWEIDITPAQLKAWEDGAPIQKVVPHLSVNEREFIISGCTPEDFEMLYPNMDEEDE